MMYNKQPIKQKWIDYLLKDGNKKVFLEKFQKTNQDFFFVEMKNEEKIVEYVEENGLQDKDEILNLLQNNTKVTNEQMYKNWKFSESEKEFIRFLWENYHFGNHELSDHKELEMLLDVLYTDAVHDEKTKKMVLSDNGKNEILKGVTLKRVDGKIVGFTKIILNPKEPDNIYIKYIFVEASYNKNNYEQSMINDVLNLYQFKKYLVLDTVITKKEKLEELGFEGTEKPNTEIKMIKKVPENKNRMKIITNGHGAMKEASFVKAKEGMDELEWRVNPQLIKMIEKRKKEIRYLMLLKNKNKKQAKRLKELTRHQDSWLNFSIAEVDLNKKWLLSEYDGAISVVYIKEEGRLFNFNTKFAD